MKALLAVDGSAHALRAAETLAALAKHCKDTRAHVLNVQPAIPYAALLGEERQGAIEGWVRQHGQEALAGACDVLTAAGVPFEVEVIAADAPLAIVRIASERHCDFILMGSRGLGAIAGMALGSVATRVLHLADRPVTLVR